MNLKAFARLTFLIALLFAGCDTTFDPFNRNDLEVSLVGFLDANADTQYVRIEMLRDSLLLGSGPAEFAVSLEDLESGERNVLQDSLFLFPNDVYARNFWTSTQVRPEHTYQLTVDPLSGGNVAIATVALPDSFAAPTAPSLTCMSLSRTCTEPYSIIIQVKGVEKLAAFTAVYHYPDFTEPAGCKIRRVSYWKEAKRTDDGYEVIIQWRRDLERIIGLFGTTTASPKFGKFDIFVAAGGPEWPDFTEIDRETFFLPDVVTNVENGIGFVGGVYSRTDRVFGNQFLCDLREFDPG